MKYFIVPLMALAIGCSSDKDADSAESAFLPTEGNWSPNDSAYREDGCNLASNPVFNVAAVDAIVYTLALTSDTTGTITIADGDPIDCTLSDMTMTCATQLVNDVSTYNDADGNPVVDDNDEPVDPDATITSDAVITVSFTDSENGTYIAAVTGLCEGADCDPVQESLGANANPCESEISGDFEME